jgi:hypothetical protein
VAASLTGDPYPANAGMGYRRRIDALLWRSVARRSATSVSATSAWRSRQASPGSWYMRATCSPAASRVRMTAMTWRLAAGYILLSAQVGEQVEAGAHL